MGPGITATSASWTSGPREKTPRGPSLGALWTAQACCPTEVEQLVLQPDFAVRDKLVSSSQLLQSASVATDWEGNEQAVSVAKSAWFLERDFWNNSSGKQMNDVRMTCSFQCNFMYDLVL